MSVSPEAHATQTSDRPELAAVRGPVTWSQVGAYEDIRLDVSEDGIAKVTICRPEVRNAFRPQTLIEISDALVIAREDPGIGVIILTGEGPDAFCSGGDQRVRGDTGYLTDPGQPGSVGRFHVTDLQIQIRRLPKPVVAMVAGYAIGGGHVLHLICDLTIAADNARFGQVGPKVGSFDGGYGAALLAELVGVKKAKEIWFLCFQYGAQEALDMGLVNTVVPLEELEAETVAWCRRMLQMSPFAIRLMKASFHAAEDGIAGIQQLAHDANLLFYSTEEAREGREAFKAKRRPEFERFPAAPDRHPERRRHRGLRWPACRQRNCRSLSSLSPGRCGISSSPRSWRAPRPRPAGWSPATSTTRSRCPALACGRPSSTRTGTRSR